MKKRPSIGLKDKAKIIFEVDRELHTQIKVLAARRNISMNRYIHRILERYIQEDMKHEQDDCRSREYLKRTDY